ncbi:MAG TPA: aldo/keto reductase [Leptolyngbyaceae cyanobacterium M65_K2018_010]|nr:aldo/keto reductase [Leptolyngbyaceae cyanobacterium M65_K2018_010]
MLPPSTRRHFLLGSAALAASLACSKGLKSEPGTAALAPVYPAMPERLLGRTGLSLPILGLGGAGQTPLSKEGQAAAAIPLIERALSLGIRYFDTAASYGPSEGYLGQVLPPVRDQVVIASKTAARDRDGAWRELERSLQRLKTDYLDVWQLHHVSFMEELDQIFGAAGAIQALEEAKAQKLVRFSGLTGHHEPAVIAAGLNRYAFDTTLICLNAADVHHPRPFAQAVLPVAQARQVGVIAMKVPAYGRLFKPGGLEGMAQAMGYTLSLPGVHGCVIAAETIPQLESNVEVARQFQPLSPTAMAAIEQRTALVWEENSFFRQWT